MTLENNSIKNDEKFYLFIPSGAINDCIKNNKPLLQLPVFEENEAKLKEISDENLRFRKVIEDSVKINWKNIYDIKKWEKENKYKENEYTNQKNFLKEINDCTIYELSYNELLKYQRIIDLGVNEEFEIGEHSYYYRRGEFNKENGSLINKELLEVLENVHNDAIGEPNEWDIIPDVFILYPVKYPVKYINKTNKDYEKILNRAEEQRTENNINKLVDELNIRLDDEFNIPNVKISWIDKVLCHIKSNANRNDNSEKRLGSQVWVDFLFAWDENSSSGVVILCSLSTPFLMSYLLDAVSNNDLMVLVGDLKDTKKEYQSVKTYLKNRFKISIHGTPKSFVIIPKGEDCLRSYQKAALISSEAILPNSFGYGHVNDKNIINAVQNNIGQYDRAKVYAYSTVLLVFNDNLQKTVNERLETESITLFFLILILFEEASICIANDEVISILKGLQSMEKESTEEGEQHGFSKIDFLEQANDIMSEYAKTMAFWKAKLKYPTSQNSLDNIRKAFGVDEVLSNFQRNHQQFETLFNIKSEIKERYSDAKTNNILFVLSMLTIASVLTDSVDFVAKVVDFKDLFDIEVESITHLTRALQLIVVLGIAIQTRLLYKKYHKL